MFFAFELPLPSTFVLTEADWSAVVSLRIGVLSFTDGDYITNCRMCQRRIRIPARKTRQRNNRHHRIDSNTSGNKGCSKRNRPVVHRSDNGSIAARDGNSDGSGSSASGAGVPSCGGCVDEPRYGNSWEAGNNGSDRRPEPIHFPVTSASRSS